MGARSVGIDLWHGIGEGLLALAHRLVLPAHLLCCVVLVGWVAAPSVVYGQRGLQSGESVSLNDGVPHEVKDVTVEQKLGDLVPLNLSLTDSLGRLVNTGDFIDGKKPTIISLNYSDCPMLCNVQLNQLCKSLKELDLQVGKDFQILTVSIDPTETTEKIRETKAKYVEQLADTHSRAQEGWAFCTAEQPVIDKLANTLGFRYTFNEKKHEYYHPAMLAFVSPTGVITRYSLALSFEPRDLRKALIESGDGTVGSRVDQLIMLCFSYDPDSNSYTAQAWKIMRLAGAATVCLMLACLAPYWIGKKAFPSKPVDDVEVQRGGLTEDEPSGSD